MVLMQDKGFKPMLLSVIINGHFCWSYSIAFKKAIAWITWAKATERILDCITADLSLGLVKSRSVKGFSPGENILFGQQ